MKYLATFIMLFGTWIMLAGLNLEEIILGGITSLVLSGIITKYVNYSINILFPIQIVLFIVLYVPVFVYKLVLANLDIARRVLSIKIPLNPGIVKIKTNLKSDYAKLTLANSITLTPGTLTMDVVDDELFVHCVDVKGNNVEENTKKISSTFEKVLEVIFK